MVAAEDYGNTTQNPDATDEERIAAFNKVRRETYHVIQQADRRYTAVIRDLLNALDRLDLNHALPFGHPDTVLFREAYREANKCLMGPDYEA